jgi:tetratricopeptide (TPR) repeat protein
VELARLLARTGREPEAEDLLRRTLDDLPKNPIAVYTLALLLIAWGRGQEAARMRDRYVTRFGQNQWTATLDRLMAAGTEGRTEAQHRLGDRDLHAARSDQPIAADGPVAEDQTAREARSAGPLHRAADASRADLLFRIQDPAAAEEALAGLLHADADDLYPQVVWALHVPQRRPQLASAYRDALGALAPHLAAAGRDTQPARWDLLAEAFPERQGLIDLTRLVRNGPDAAAQGRIADWIAGGEEHDAFLRARLKSLIERDGGLDPATPEPEPLLADAIRREVDLGDGVLGEAA